MEANSASYEHEDQDEYVLLDLDSVSNLINLPANAKYVLTVSSPTGCPFFIFFTLCVSSSSTT